MAENQITPNSAHPYLSKIYPLAIGDISQLPSSPPHQPSQIKKLTKLIFNSVFVISGSITLTTLICILVYFTLGPKLPSLHLNTFSVSNFTTTASTNLIANWDFYLTLKNPDHLWQIYLDYIDCIVFYQEDYTLAVNHSVAAPFKVKPMKENTIHVKLATGDSLIFLNHQLLHKINREWRNGMVVFSLAVRAKTRFVGISWLWWTEFADPMYNCLDLKVGFKGHAEADVGMFIGGRLPRQC